MALTEQQMEVIGEKLTALYQDFERAVIRDISRRLVKTGRLTETAELMAATLREKGWSPSKIYTQVMKSLEYNEYWQKEIAQNTLAVKRELKARIDELNEQMGEAVEETMQETGALAFHNDLEVWKKDALPVKDSAFEQLVKVMTARLAGELINLTKTTGFKLGSGAVVNARETYAREVNNAFIKMTSGAYSYGQAIEEAVRELAKSGLRTVDYESGVTRQIDTAVRNAVMTASSQLAGEITMNNAAQADVNHVEVSSHLGAREGKGHGNHLAWQGKVYRVEGSDAEYENLEEATGYPSDPTGLCGYNCRHTFYPFWPGISEPTPPVEEPPPVEVGGKTYTYYKATREQRRRERQIRALKREANSLKDIGKDDKPLRALIRTKTSEYKDFSEAVGIRAKTERLRVGSYAAVQAKKPLQEQAGSGIMSVNTADGGGDVQTICKTERI